MNCLKSSELQTAAKIAVTDSLKVKSDEQVLIISNPESNAASIAQALYDEALFAKARPVLLFQPVKTQMDFAEPAIIAAFSSKPEVCISLSAEKLGKDRHGIAHAYTHKNIDYEHIFHLQLYGEKSCRGFWSPSSTVESFIRTVPIDYELLRMRCAKIKAILDEAISIHITTQGGTDIWFGLQYRESKTDDGDFSCGGKGGNLPAGEVYISPENGSAQGEIVFDGSINLHNESIIIQEPIRCIVNRGFITEIKGGKEAAALLESIQLAEGNAYCYEKSGKLPSGSGAIYAINARNIGEIGIGLNPNAKITGHILEDEKAFYTCHFAVGHNYDGDAPSLIHLDGLVRNPTIISRNALGEENVIEQDGKLMID